MHLKQVALRGGPARIACWVAVHFEMPVRIVNSKQNARLKELRRALRSPDAKGGVIGIEGPNLIEEAIRAGLRIRCVFISEGVGGVRPHSWQLDNCETLAVPRAILTSVLETETPQPAAALVEPPEWTWAHVFAQPRVFPENPALVVVLAGLQDPGNLGSILRSAEAFGANGVVALPGTVSPWNQKVMRASAGSWFRVPMISAAVDECFAKLAAARVDVLTTAMNKGVAADAVDFT